MEKALFNSVAASKDAAILSAGHAAENALWYDVLEKMEGQQLSMVLHHNG